MGAGTHVAKALADRSRPYGGDSQCGAAPAPAHGTRVSFSRRSDHGGVDLIMPFLRALAAGGSRICCPGGLVPGVSGRALPAGVLAGAGVGAAVGGAVLLVLGVLLRRGAGGKRPRTPPRPRTGFGGPLLDWGDSDMTSRFTELAIDCGPIPAVSPGSGARSPKHECSEDDGIVTIGSPIMPQAEPPCPSATDVERGGQEPAPPRPPARPTGSKTKRSASPARPRCPARRRRPRGR